MKIIRYCRNQKYMVLNEMLNLLSGNYVGAGLGKKCCLITYRKVFRGSHGFVVGHVTPEAYDGGGIALILKW
jgi:dihydroxy-acid dehydratase